MLAMIPEMTLLSWIHTRHSFTHALFPSWRTKTASSGYLQPKITFQGFQQHIQSAVQCEGYGLQVCCSFWTLKQCVCSHVDFLEPKLQFVVDILILFLIKMNPVRLNSWIPNPHIWFPNIASKCCLNLGCAYASDEWRQQSKRYKYKVIDVFLSRIHECSGRIHWRTLGHCCQCNCVVHNQTLTEVPCNARFARFQGLKGIHYLSQKNSLD